MGTCSSSPDTPEPTLTFDPVPAGLLERQYPFENLVFEGGGTKCMAYAGCISVLEEAGLLKQMTRFAGTSGGAMFASLLSFGVPAPKILDDLALKTDPRDLAFDARFGMASLVPNLLGKFGWNPGTRMLKYFRKTCKEITGKADITFKEAYDKYQKELCIVVTNLTKMRTEYFHVKTSPDVPIATAVRMSVSLPAMFQPVQYNGDYYIDGGLLINYPIRCFDGWYLSMEKDDSFFYRIPKHDDKFSGFNKKTLGALVYASDDGEAMQGKLQARYGFAKPERPNTPLAQQRGQKMDELLERISERANIVEKVSKFADILQQVDNSRDEKICINEFQQVFQSESMKKEDMEVIFGKDFDIQEAFEQLDKESNGEVTFQEFLRFMENKGVNMKYCVHHEADREIHALGDYIASIVDTLDMHVKQLTLQHEDIHRCIGINTDYISTADFSLEVRDKHFLVKQGRKATVAFLEEYIKFADKSQSADAEQITDQVQADDPQIVQQTQERLVFMQSLKEVEKQSDCARTVQQVELTEL